MKTLLILILAAALVAAAHFTRPSKNSFKTMVKEEVARSANPMVANLAADVYMDQVRFRDHFLWVSVEKNGRTLYVGAFAHWFSKLAPSEAPAGPVAVVQ